MRPKPADLDRVITTSMSANIVRAALKQGWTIQQIAELLAAPQEFVEGVRAKRHVLTTRDIKRLARQMRQPFQTVLLNSLPARPGLAPLLEATRRSIEISTLAGVGSRSRSRSASAKSRAKNKAA